MSNRRIFLCIFLFPLTVTAADWPNWMGPTGNNIYVEEGILTTFPEDGLRTLWECEVGLGYAGPAVAEGKVYVMDYLREGGDITNNPGSLDELTGKERVLCIDAQSGRLLWKYEYERPYRMSYPSGPRATPAVVDGKVYALGGEGNLNVLDAETGRQIWSKDFKQDYGAETPVWGFASHPYVDGDTLYCLVGGEGSLVVAFDKDSGKEKWKALNASSQGYCPPFVLRHQGVEQLIVWYPEAVCGLDPATGEVYWSEEVRPSWGGSIQVPRFSDNRLFVAGPGAAAMFELNVRQGRPGAELLWRGNPRIAVYPVNGNVVFESDAIYAVDSGGSALMAIDPDDGDRLWETREPVTGSEDKRLRHGTAFLVPIRDTGTFYIMSETGDLILAELTPAGYREIGRQNILEPTNSTTGRSVVWSHPAFAGHTLFARNDKKLVAIDLKKMHYDG